MRTLAMNARVAADIPCLDKAATPRRAGGRARGSPSVRVWEAIILLGRRELMAGGGR